MCTIGRNPTKGQVMRFTIRKDKSTTWAGQMKFPQLKGRA